MIIVFERVISTIFKFLFTHKPFKMSENTKNTEILTNINILTKNKNSLKKISGKKSLPEKYEEKYEEYNRDSFQNGGEWEEKLNEKYEEGGENKII